MAVAVPEVTAAWRGEDAPSRLSLDRRLRRKVALLGLLACLMLLALARSLLALHLQVGLAVGSLSAGVLVGWWVGRSKRLAWSPGHDHIVTQSTWWGTVVFTLYLLFVWQRERLVGFWVRDASQLAGVSLAVSLGAILGQLWAIRSGLCRLWWSQQD